MLLSSFSCKNDTINEDCFLLAWNIARTICPYGEEEEEEFIKNLKKMVKILDPSKTKLHKLIA